MRFRFTLSHTIEGSLEITEPSGWIDSTLKLERHEDFHSLLEHFSGSFIFYGNDGIVNGGIEYIKNIEQTYGLDEKITIDIDITFDEVTFSNVFNGQFNFADLEEMMDNKLRLPITRDDFWSKFISRLDIPVNIQSTSNVDNLPVSAVENIVLELPSQKIRYIGSYKWGESYTYYQDDDFGGNPLNGMQLDWEAVLIDDLKKFTIPRARITLDKNGSVGIGSDDVGGVIQPDSLFGNFEAPFDGDYTFDIKMYTGEYNSIGNVWVQNLHFFYVFKTTETAQTLDNQFTRSVINCGSDDIMMHAFNKTIRLLRGEQVALWGRTGTFGVTIFGDQRLEWHNVVVASTTSLVLSGEQTIDGILTSTSHILVKNNVDPSENGIWVTAAGAWTRATYADTPEELSLVAVFVTLGTTNANSAWRQDNVIQTVDLDDQSWIFIIPSDERFRPFPCGFEVENYLRITADTTFPTTDADGVFIHDAAAAICDRIIGEDNTFYSELLGSSLTRARQYDEDGCAWAYGLSKGLHVRQYTLQEKPFFMSFNQWWRGANPILNLGLGYDSIPSTDPGILPDTLPDLEDWGVFTGFSSEPMLWTTGTPTAICFVDSGVSVGGFSDIVHPIGMVFTVGKTYKYGYTFTVHVDPPTVTEDVEIHIQAYNGGLIALDEKVEFYVADNGATIQPAGEWEFIAPVGMAHLGVIAVYPNGSTADGLVTINTFVDLLEAESSDTDAVIRVEEKSYFYLDEILVYFSNVRTITRKYDNDRIFNKAEVGYNQWQSEDISGLDDPQTKKTYSTRFQKVGKSINLYSEFIAASLAGESARRKARGKSSDYKFDNETFIFALDPTEIDISPDESLIHLSPELDENFDSITNLTNSDTRYNLKLTPARNFLRWQNYLQGALQPYLGSVFKFTSGEGNYDMTSEMEVNGCLNEDYDGDVLDEKGDIPVTADFIHLPHLYELTIPMEWTEYQAIRDNRRNAIGISLSDVDHVPMFIKTLEYKPVKGTCNLLLWAKEYLDLSVTPDTTPMQECQPESDACEDSLTDEDGNILTDELGVCITS